MQCKDFCGIYIPQPTHELKKKKFYIFYLLSKGHYGEIYNYSQKVFEEITNKMDSDENDEAEEDDYEDVGATEFISDGEESDMEVLNN